MKLEFPSAVRSASRRYLLGAVAVVTALSVTWGGAASAEPAQDPLADLAEMKKRTEQLTEDIKTAQLVLDTKLQAMRAADDKQAADLAAFLATQDQLAAYRGSVDRFLASVYMGGRTDDVTAILTAASPTGLIDKMSVQRVVAAQMTEQMRNLNRVNQEARIAEMNSAISAAQARAAVNEAAGVRADLTAKQSQLRADMAEATERAVLVSQPSAVMAALGQIAPIPTVGMNGLVPNARRLVAYIMATYPGVRSIGGVRPDPLPDHPSGRAIDIMVADMGLGDAIHADIERQAARFGVVYTMWRVAAHFDHIHVTVS